MHFGQVCPVDFEMCFKSSEVSEFFIRFAQALDQAPLLHHVVKPWNLAHL